MADFPQWSCSWESACLCWPSVSSSWRVRADDKIPQQDSMKMLKYPNEESNCVEHTIKISIFMQAALVWFLLFCQLFSATFWNISPSTVDFQLLLVIFNVLVYFQQLAVFSILSDPLNWILETVKSTFGIICPTEHQSCYLSPRTASHTAVNSPSPLCYYFSFQACYWSMSRQLFPTCHNVSVAFKFSIWQIIFCFLSLIRCFFWGGVGLVLHQSRLTRYALYPFVSFSLLWKWLGFPVLWHLAPRRALTYSQCRRLARL